MKRIVTRLRKEPALVRVLLMSLLNILVLGGIVDPGLSEQLEIMTVALISLALGVDIRRNVRPYRKGQGEQ
jgi:hypothetical protein